MKTFIYFLLGMMLATFLFASCTKKEETGFLSPPEPTVSLAKLARYTSDSTVYIVTKFYSDKEDKYQSIPQYMRDDTYMFKPNGQANRWGNMIVNPWAPYETIEITNWQAYAEGIHPNGIVKFNWKNVITYEPTTYVVKDLKDESCTMVMSYVDTGGQTLYIHFSKLLQ